MSTTTFNQTLTDQNRFVSTAAHAAIYQLLPAAGCPVRAYTFGKSSADANTVTLQPAGSDTINGATSLVLTSLGTVTIKPIPGGWIVVAQTATTIVGGGGTTGSGAALTLVANLPAGVYQAAYSGSLAATGGTQPYTYSIVSGSGSLPAGLTLNASTGQISGSPSVTGTFTFTGKVVDSTTGTPLNQTVACSLTVTTAGASSPIPECTGFTAVPAYSVTADGVEQWQDSITATPPADVRFVSAQAILCPCAVLASSIASTTSGYAGGTITINVTPWAVPSQVTVAADGKTMTITGGPNFNPAMTTNYCCVAGVENQIASYTSATVAVLRTAVTPGTGITFLPSEARFGLMQDQTHAASGVGDTISIDTGTTSAETFTIAALSGVLNQGTGQWAAQWTLNRTAGAHPAHTNYTTAPVAYGSSYGFQQLIIDIAGVGVNKMAGSIVPGAAWSVGSPVSGANPAWPIGAPTAYVPFLVAQSAAGMNAWPVSTTPHATPFTAEVQTTGSLSSARLASTQLGPGLTGGGGNPIQLAAASSTIGDTIQNGGFEQLPLGTCWLTSSGASSLYSPGFNSPYCLKVTPGTTVNQVNQSGSSYNIPVDAESQYILNLFTRVDSGATGSNYATVAWLNASGGVIGYSGLLPWSTNTTWTEITQIATAPSGAVFASVVVSTNGTGTGNWYADDVTFAPLPAVTSGIAYDSFGNTINSISSAVSGDLVHNGGFELYPTGCYWKCTSGSASIAATGYNSAQSLQVVAGGMAVDQCSLSGAPYVTPVTAKAQYVLVGLHLMGLVTGVANYSLIAWLNTSGGIIVIADLWRGPTPGHGRRYLSL